MTRRSTEWILRLLALAVGGYAFVGGAVSLLGWVLDVPRLTNWDGNGISIQPNATVCVMAAGLGLMLLAAESRRIGGLVGSVAGVIGAATLFQYVSGIDLGIDRLLMFGREWGRVGVIAPGRMGPPGTVSWTLVGAAFVLAGLPLGHRARRFAVPLALATLAISLTSTISYLYGATVLYTLPHLTVIALQTATFVMAVSFGLIAAVPERQPMRLLLEPSTPGLLRYALPAIFIVPILLGFIRVNAQNAGYFDTAFGSTLRTVDEIILLIGLLWWLLRRVERHERSERASDERADAVLGSITDAFYALDKEWRFSFVNDEIVRRFGMRREEIVGGNIWELFPRAVGNEAYVGLQRAMAECVSVEYDVFYEPWQLWFHEKAYPTADGGLAVYSQDITERKLAENTIRQNEADARLLQTLAAEMLAPEDDLAAFAEKFVDAAVAVMRADFASLQMLRPESGKLWLMSFRGFNPEAARFWEWVRPDSASSCGVALATGERVIVPDIEICDFMAGSDDLATYLQTGIRAVQTTPLVSRSGEVLGMISTHWRGAHTPSERELLNLDILARQAADLLEREGTQQAVRGSEERLRALVTATADVTYRMSADWSELQPMDGRSLVAGNEGPIRDWMQKNIPSDERERVAAAFRAAIEAKRPFELEHRVLRPDGSEGWTFSRAVPILDERGEIAEWFGAAADITDRKLADQALQKSEAEFRQLANSVPQIVFVNDAEGKTLFVNDRWTEFSGLTLDQTNDPELLAAVFHPDDWPRMREVSSASMANGEEWDVECRMKNQEGEYCWLLVRALPQPDESGTIVKWYGTSTDITEKRRTEAQLRELIERCPFGIYIVDSSFRIVQVNAGSREGAFANVRPLIGRPFDEAIRILWPENVAAGIVGNFRRTLETGEPYYSKDFVNPRSDIDLEEGYEWELHRIILADGQFGVICYYYDSTKLRQVERALRDSIDREKATRLEAERANRAKDEFLAVLSHELRTPLHSIKGWISLLRGGSLDQGQQRQGLDVIARNVEAQNALIEDILDVSRIVLGKLGLEKETVSLSKVVRETVDAMRPAAEAAGIRLEVEIADDRMESAADPFRIRQIVSNLVGNAVKFTPYGGAVTVRFERDGATARLLVSDTGVGIPGDVLPRIFDRFEQADGSRRRKYAGLGLGLAIVKHITEMHGGSITAESSGENLGAAFTIELPLRAADEAAIHASNGPSPLDGEKVLNGLAILVVDDDLDALDMLEVSLRAAGAETRAVRSAAEAIDSMRRRKFDFLLSDLGMPRVDGFDLIRAVRKELFISPEEMPAMALSGYTGAEDREHSIASGYQLHSAKPVDLSSLPGLILSLTRRSGAAETV